MQETKSCTMYNQKVAPYLNQISICFHMKLELTFPRLLRYFIRPMHANVSCGLQSSYYYIVL